MTNSIKQQIWTFKFIKIDKKRSSVLKFFLNDFEIDESERERERESEKEKVRKIYKESFYLFTNKQKAKAINKFATTNKDNL